MNYSFIFDFSFPLLAIILCSALVVCFLLQLIVAALSLLRTSRFAAAPKPDPADSGPHLSVVALGEAPDEELEAWLNEALSQNYTNYQVIVVTDGSPERTAELMKRFGEGRENLYMTFIPQGSRSLSRRKLALTLGIKAAKGEYVVLTSTACNILGPDWLGAIAARLEDSDKEVVAGYVYPSEIPAKGLKRLYGFFEFTTISARWLSSAIGGKIWRADGLNLTFRRDLFFSNKGYADSTLLHGGDDDLFLRRICTPRNTAVMLDPRADLALRIDRTSASLWRSRIEHYDFMRRFMPRAPFRRSGFGSLMQWLMLGLLTAIGILFHQLFWVLVAAFLILVCVCIVQILIYRRCAAALHTSPLCFSVPLMLLCRPVGNFFMRLRTRRHIARNYTQGLSKKVYAE